MKALLLAVSAGFCAATCFWMFLADHMPSMDGGRSGIAFISSLAAVGFFLGAAVTCEVLKPIESSSARMIRLMSQRKIQ